MEKLYWILAVAAAGPVAGSALGVAFRPQPRAMGRMLAFAGGVMLAISFLELLPESMAQSGLPGAAAGLAVGFLVMAALDCLLPQNRNGELPSQGPRNLWRTSVLMILAIFFHNLPEGMAMAASTAMEDPGAVVTVALAIAIHNIPEGICTSAPYYYATGDRLGAFLRSSATALPVLVGFWLGRIFLLGANPFAMGTMVAAAAGLMIHISCQELIPSALDSCSSLPTMAWLTGGVVFVLVLGTL